MTQTAVFNFHQYNLALAALCFRGLKQGLRYMVFVQVQFLSPFGWQLVSRNGGTATFFLFHGQSTSKASWLFIILTPRLATLSTELCVELLLFTEVIIKKIFAQFKPQCTLFAKIICALKVDWRLASKANFWMRNNLKKVWIGCPVPHSTKLD